MAGECDGDHEDGAPFELAERDTVELDLGDLGDEGRLDFDAYGVVPIDDEQQSRGRLVEPFDLLDLRDELDHELPDCDDGGDAAWLYGVDLLDDGPTEPVALGAVYPSGKGVVLARSAPIATVALAWLSSPTVNMTRRPCPTRRPVTGEGRYSTVGYKTRAAARRAGSTLAASRAKTDAGLVRNAEQCPAGCRRKRVRGLRVFLTRTTHVSVFFSLGWGEWRYRAEGYYWWWALVECY